MFIKKYLILLLLVLLSNCAAPGTALLSPVITGATTKSTHQAAISLASSLSSNHVIKHHGEKIKKKMIENNRMIFNYLSSIHQNKKLSLQ